MKERMKSVIQFKSTTVKPVQQATPHKLIFTTRYTTYQYLSSGFQIERKERDSERMSVWTFKR